MKYIKQLLNLREAGNVSFEYSIYILSMVKYFL